MIDAAEGERFEEAAQLRDAMRTVQTLHDRQQKMATRRARPPRRVRPEARARRASSCRCSRCGAAASSSGSSSAPRPPLPARREGEVLEAAMQQFYELRVAPPEVHVPAEPDDRDALETWLVATRRPARPHASCRSAARSAAWSIWRTATRRSPIRTASTSRRPRSTTRSRRCAPSSRCRRFRAASSASTSPRFRAARPSRRWSCAKTGG